MSKTGSHSGYRHHSLSRPQRAASVGKIPVWAWALLLWPGVLGAADGIAVSARYQGKNENLHGGWGAIYRYTIRAGSSENPRVIYPGPARFATLNQKGTHAAYIKKNGRVGVVDINGDDTVDLVDAGSGKGYLDWPTGPWIYYSRGGYGETGSREVWKVNSTTRATRKVVTFNTKMWVWGMNADGTRMSVRNTDNDLCGGTGRVIHVTLPSSLPASLQLNCSGWYQTCGNALSPTGTYACAFSERNYGHNKIDIRRWDKKIEQTFTLKQMNGWGKAMGSGGNRTRWSANSDEWICFMQGWDGRAAGEGSNQVLYNWKRKQQIVVTANKRNSGSKNTSWQAEAGDFWVGNPDAVLRAGSGSDPGGVTPGDSTPNGDTASPVTLLTPNGGGTFRVGDTITVRWQADTTTVKNIAVDVSFNSGRSWYTVSGEKTVDAGTPQWGRYIWRIPANLVSSTGARVPVISGKCRVKVWEPYGELRWDQSDRDFTIAAASAATRPSPGRRPQQTLRHGGPVRRYSLRGTPLRGRGAAAGCVIVHVDTRSAGATIIVPGSKR